MLVGLLNQASLSIWSGAVAASFRCFWCGLCILSWACGSFLFITFLVLWLLLHAELEPEREATGNGSGGTIAHDVALKDHISVD